MYSRPITTLNLSPFIRGKLLKAGFKNTKDLEGITPVGLSRELTISNEEALVILQQVRQENVDSFSATEALEREKTRCPISTGCSDLDEMFGSRGIMVGKITEFCGVPGIGKTQLGMQLALNVQIPKSLGGPEGEAIYIDTEGSFIAQRTAEIAEGTIERINQQLHEKAIDAEPLQVESMLARIHYFRVLEYTELVALVNLLEEFLETHTMVKIIIIDSIAFHFRLNFTDMGLRTRLLNGIAQTLLQVADSKDIAVVLMNQMTTKINHHAVDKQNEAVLVPALGESWGHASTNRVILFWKDGVRNALLYKSPSMGEKVVQYQVTAHGIQEYEESRKRMHSDP
ncbi:hypothetical protein K7432_002945 [Basidiobolus ranarum]|uniref:DNA repair protein RAD51 homolog 3 n=1 Tax=Basidiobolus ranarum TaxID=34480 RepID=A0ABR2W775_9FUNG